MSILVCQLVSMHIHCMLNVLFLQDVIQYVCTGEHAEEVWTLFAAVPDEVWRGPEVASEGRLK